MHHQPVLTNELISLLSPQPNQLFIDATLGLAGHARKILTLIAPQGRVLGIEQDKKAIDFVKKRGISRLDIVKGNFKNIAWLAKRMGYQKVDGVYFDLGLGSWQIEDSRYGLSYQKDMPLLMKVDDEGSEISVKEVVNKFPAKMLAKILGEYGNVTKPYQIAYRIARYREKKVINTTLDLKEASGVKNPESLARIFQAFRIFVNQELENLQSGLKGALEILKKGGRLAVISYHSGEDRIVKNFFRENEQKEKMEILTKKPVIPDITEVKQNPRARSAKLRVGIKL